MRVGGEGEDRLAVHGHLRLGAGAFEAVEDLVVVHDDPVVDPDNRPVPDRVVVRRDRRMTLRVVPDVNENLPCRGWNLEALQQVARRRSLLHHGRERLSRGAVRIPDGVCASVGDAGEQGLSRERPVDARIRAQAVAGYSAHEIEIVKTPSEVVYPFDASR